MKRDDRENQDNDDFDQQKDDFKKSKYIEAKIRLQQDAWDDQMQAYMLRQKVFFSHIEKCVNDYDPIYPDRKLKMNDALFFLYDKNGRRWCFNLITLWPKFEATNSYDIERLYSHHGNILLSTLDTKETEFHITIRQFVYLKKSYYKYAHNIDWNPTFL